MTRKKERKKEEKDPDLTFFFASTKKSRGRELRVYLPHSQQLVEYKIVFLTKLDLFGVFSILKNPIEYLLKKSIFLYFFLYYLNIMPPISKQTKNPA